MKPVLSPKEVAKAIGVSESSLKRWADDGLIRVSRTAGGHRRIAITEAIRFVRETRAPIVRPDILGIPELEAAAADRGLGAGDEAERLFAYLRDGRAAEARGLLLSLYLAGEHVAAIIDGPLHGAMAKLGELWRHDKAGIFIEHRATDICIQALHQLRATFLTGDAAPVAVGGAPTRDPYLLPTLAAAAVLESEGYRAINLGPDTPLDALRHAVDKHSPQLAWVSISTEALALELPTQLAELVRELATTGVRLAVGGQAVAQLNLSPHENLFLGSTMRELSAFARGLRNTGVRGHDAPPWR